MRRPRRSASDGSRPWSVAARAIASIVAVAVVVTGLSVVQVGSAEAAVVRWGTNSGTAPNYQATVNGDFIVAGNGVLACSATTDTTSGTCDNLHAASSSNSGSVNDNFVMSNSNTVAGFATNSSSATITIPARATVAKAFLGWSANTGVYTGDARPLCTAYSAARGTATMPAGATTGYRTRPVQLKVGSAATQSVAPTSVLEDPTSQATALYYSATADVTAAFAGAATGAAIPVSAGDLWAPTGAGCFAGWSLTVVYDFGTYIPGNASSIAHRVIYYEGHVREGSTDTPLTVAFNGFTAVDVGTRAGFTLFEGDRNIVGDTAQYSRQNSTTYTEIANSAGATGNIGIGRAAGSTRYTQTANSTAFTNQSVDVATSALSTVVAGDTSVNLRLGTSGDSYLLTNAVLSVPTAGLQVSKSYDGTADTQSRTSTEPATFTVVLTNSGAGALRNLVTTDDQPDCARTLTGVVLQPTQSYTYTCVAAAASAGTYVSTTTATGYTSVGNYLASDDDSTTILLSSLTLAKTSALAAGATGRAGDVVTYTFTVRNNGSSPLTGVAVTDPLPGLSAVSYTWPTATAGALAAGQSATATATRTLTQADVDAGSVANTASVTATDSDGGLKPGATASRTTPLAAAPAIAVTKTGAYAAGATGRVGDRINYTFAFTNSGNVTLTGLALSDPLAGLSTPVVVWPGATGTLAPGQTATATAAYTVRQSDVDRGVVTNQATVTGRTPANAAVTGTSTTVSLSTVAPAPALSTTKTGTASGGGGVGQTITYSFRATNTGNVTLTGVAIGDPLPGLSARAYTWPGAAGVLAPGQSVTATSTYVITQADVDAQAVRNIATAVGTSPNGTAVATPSTESVVATAASAPALTFRKTGALAAGSRAGDSVAYTFTFANSGNVTLTGVGATDALPGLSALVFGAWPSGTTGTLAPGQSVTATATYTLKQSDVDAGAVSNTATATAKPPVGANVVRTAAATVPVTAAGALAVTKSSSLASGTGGVGSTLSYSFTIRNDGNVTLSQVALTDPLPGLSTPVITWPGTPGVLLPGATANATATYTVRQSDVDAGAVRNTAAASATTPRGESVTASSAQSTFGTPAAAPAITTSKTAVRSGSGAAGDVITYTLRASNTGNVTLTGVTVSDALPGLSTPVYSWPSTAGTLAPGQTVTATASYTIRQSDVNSGVVRNTSTAAADFGATRVSATSATVSTATATPAPALTTTKSGALAAGAVGRAGDTVNWTVTLANTGNVTLTGASIADALPGISAFSYGAWTSGTTGTLQPAQSVVATATYRLTQADVDAGAVANAATGSASPPSGPAVSSSAPATVPLPSGAALSISKTGATSGNGSVGDTVTFSFVVRNSGNVTLRAVSIADSLPGLSGVVFGSWPSATGELAPGAQVTATATYAVRQSDVNAGVVRNTATASATTPAGTTVSAQSATATVFTAAAAPSITTTKTASVGGAGAVGDVITYTVVARNTGNVTLTAVTVEDPLLGPLAVGAWPGGVAGQLQPAAAVTATGSYVITQADVNAGAVRNVATSTASFGAVSVSGASGQVVTPTQSSAPALSLQKDGTLPAGSTGRAGDTVSYTFTARNTGNVTLTGVTITDAHPGLSAITYGTWPGGSAGVLQPGASVTATASYQLTQTDVDSGAVVNSARATASPPTGSAVAVEAAKSVALSPVGGITVSKTGSVAGAGAVGDTVTFAFAIGNPGTVTLSGVQLVDTFPGLSAPAIVWPGAPGVLPPGATATATATYVVRQADVDAGSIANRATASGRTPAGVVESAQSQLAVVPTAAPAPSLTVTKSASPSSAAVAGSAITYSIGVTNSGNQSLTGIAVTDSLPGISAVALTWPGAAGTLAPGQTATGRATYVVTQADVDRGSVSNTASAAGTAPGAVSVTAASPAAVTTTVAPNPALTLVKTGTLAAGSTARAGDAVGYTFVLRNTGNVTVTGATVADPLPGLSPVVYGAWPTSAGVLAPGQQVTASASYVLAQADIDAGSVANTATGGAVAPSGDAVVRTAAATVPLAAGAAVSVVKTGSVSSGNGSVGDTITFRFTVRNPGNVTLNGVALTDPLPGVSAISYGAWPDGTPGRLLPNAQVTATASYTITQADVDAGAVRNTATATATTPTGAVTSATSAPIAVATAAAGPSLDTTKSATYTSGSGGVGSELTYTLRAVNTGNVTLTGVVLSDPLPGLGNPAFTWSGGTPGTLAPGGTVTGVATYTVTQADVDAGLVANTAVATGQPPSGAAVSDASPRLVTATAPSAPLLSVTKSGALPATPLVAGSIITWSVVLANNGNVTLTGVGATDSLPGMGPLVFDAWPGAPGRLAPGQSVLGTATYALTQADLDSGAVVNTAVATGTPPSGAAATGSGTATVALAADARLSVGKTAALVAPGTGAVGDTIAFTFPVSNTGNVTVSGIAVRDPLPGLGPITYGAWPSGAAGTLAPGQQVQANATYVIRQSDVNVGSVVNRATVSGRTSAGAAVSASSATVTTPTTARTASVDVGKSAAVSGTAAVGDTVSYTVTARNSGSVTLTELVLADTLPGLTPLSYGAWPGGTAGTLQPGAQIVATTNYVLTQADVDRGFVVNTATASAASQVTPVVTGASPAVTTPTAVAAADAALVKTGTLAAGARGVAGDTVQYGYRLTNTGNVTLSNVTVSDPMPGLAGFAVTWPGPAGDLRPAQSATAVATYTLTQADVDAGSVSNVASASATTPSLTPLQRSTARTVAIAAQPGLEVAKSAAVGPRAVGDRIEYTISMRNTGNVTLTGVALDDALAGLSEPVISWPTAEAGTLPAGSQATATASYVITLADFDRGSVSNTATATATTPTGVAVSDSSDEVVVATGTKRLELRTTKTATVSGTGTGLVGETISYSFTVTNTGNVSLEGVELDDPLLPADPQLEFPGAEGQLLPDEVATATSSRLITQADVDAGSVVNTVTATATPPAPDGPITSPRASVTTATAAATPAITVSKSGTAASTAGDEVDWTFVVTNSGNVSLSEVTLTDILPGVTPVFGAWPATPGTLAPGTSVTATASSVVTQADVDAGAIVNAVTAAGRPARGAQAASTASDTVTLTPTGALTIDKAVVGTAADTLGETAAFQFTVVNTGNVTLTGVTVNDALAGLSEIAYTDWDGNPAGTLAPGDTLVATAEYTLAQADIDRGSVSNTATATGRLPAGGSIESPADTAEITTVTRSYGLTVVKSASLAGSGAVGDVITYSLSAVNSGNTTVVDVELADALPGAGDVTYGEWPRSTPGTLLPGDGVRATVRYVVTQADVDAGSVGNTATAAGTTVLGTPVSGASAAVVTDTAAADPRLALTKTGGLAPGATGRVGDIVRYDFSLANRGNVTLGDVAIADPLPGLSALVYTWPASAPAGTLAPGAVVTASANYALTQSDIDSGAVLNAATAAATAPDATSVDAASDPVTVVVEPAASLSAVKTGVLRAGGTGAVGDLIDYAVTVTNTGNVTVFRGQLLDPLPGISDPVIDWPDPQAPGVLPVGRSVVGRASYPLTQQDIDRGFISNIADVRAFTPNNQPVLATTNEVVISTVQPAPGLLVQKSALVSGDGAVGDTVGYSFVVRNNGNVSLSGVTLADALPGLELTALAWPDSNPAHVLAPGESAETTGSYRIRQADVDAGVVVNTATASGVTPAGVAVSFDSLVVTTPVAPSRPVLDVEKTGALAGGPGVAGDTVQFGFVLSNNGNVRLTAVQLADALPGIGAVTFGEWPGGVEGALDPAQSVTATAQYALTQADIDAGSVVNAVTASASPPRGTAVSDVDSAAVPITPTPDLEVVKLQSLGTQNGSLGDTVDYSFSVRNTGNVTLSGVVLTDELAGVSDPSVTWPGTPNVLAPGETATATATYRLTQADIDRGSVQNTATASAITPTGDRYSEASPPAVTTTTERDDSIDVTKTAVVSGTGAVGDTVRYTIRMTNSGNVSLSGVDLSDTMAGLSSPRITWPTAAGELLPGETATATADYTVVQADVDRGFVLNSASATAESPIGTVADDSGPVTTALAVSAPAIDVTSAGALAPGLTGRAGDRVDYRYTLRNTGNVSLTGVALADPLPGLTPLDYAWPAGTAAGTLAPGATVTATASYLLTQADVDSGVVTATTSGSGEAAATPTTPQSTARDSSTAAVTIASAPLLTPVKTGRILAPGIGQVGDTVEYVLTISNDGNVTLYDGVLLDPLPGLGVPVITWPNPAAPGVLPPGTSVTGVATYALSQADVDRGFISNIADVAAYTPGTAPSGHQRVVATSNEVIVRTVLASPGIAVSKEGTPRADAATGDTIDYSFGVANTGNVTLTGVTLSDPLTGVQLGDIVWPDAARPGEIAPGRAAGAAGSYVVTQSDVDAGAVVNTATASGAAAGSGGGTVTGSATSTEPTAAIGPELTLTKSVGLSANTVHFAGETVSWGYSVTNSGNVTLTAITLADALAGITGAVWDGGSSAPITLQPGQTATATATSVLTQQQIDAGGIGSEATATGSPPRGAAVTAAARADAAIAADPDLTTSKQGVAEAPGGVGDGIDYGFVVSNTGNVTLSSIGLVDGLNGVSAPVFDWGSRPEGILAPGESVAATADYTIDQADVDAGSVSNVATASGKPPVGDTVSASSPTSVTSTQASAPVIETVKTATVRGPGGVGSLIDYAFTIRNTGNVTLTGVALADPLVGLTAPAVTWPGAAGVLEPGQSATAAANYVIRQADVDAGSVSNTATTTATAPDGTPVSGVSNPVVADTVAADPRVSVTKESRLEPGSVGDAGDDVQYLFRVTNSGNVTLTGVDLSDDLSGLSAVTFTWPTATPGTLAPGESATAIADYLLTQTDVDAGAVSNVVTATAASPATGAVSAVASNTQPLAARPALAAVKTGVLRAPGIGQVGDIVEYTLVATNTGNVTLTRGRLIDPLPGLSQPIIDWPGTPGTLLVGQSVTGRATYPLTQADIDRGFIENTARVGATAPGGTDVTQSTNTVVVATVQPQPRLALTKTGVADGDGGVGDSIRYSFVIENTGNVSVTGAALNDQLEGLSTPVVVWPGAAGVLRPGDRATATASYAIDQADVDAGSVTNVAQASGTPARGTLDPVAATVTTATVVARTTVSASNSGTLLSAAAPRAGDTVRWDYSFTNSGNVTLSAVSTTDALPGVSAPTYAWPGTPGELAPNSTVRASATYVLTQADIDSGAVASLVTGYGAPPVGAPGVATAPATVSLAPSAALSVTKAATLPGGNGVGDTVSYTFVIRNTGNVTLGSVVLADALRGITAPVVVWPATPGALAPGAEATATASYVIQQEDVDAGAVASAATVTAAPPSGAPLRATSNTTTTPTQAPSPTIATAGRAEYVSGSGGAGSVIRYTFDITNTGNVTLRLSALQQQLAGVSRPVFSYPSTTGILAPGDVAVATSTYTVTNADVDAGSVLNAATSFGTVPSGAVVSGASAPLVTATAAARPAISVVNTAALRAGAAGELGDLIDYRFVVSNSGNTTLTGVSLANEVAGLRDVVYTWPAGAGVLGAGQSVVVTASREVTQSDVDAGLVRNVSTASGLTVSGASVSAQSGASQVSLAAGTTLLVLDKTATVLGGGPAAVGSTVRYDFTVTNPGTVSVAGVTISDTMPGLPAVVFGAWPTATAGLLPPGTSVQATADYTVKQADFDAGSISNTATVSGTSTRGVAAGASSGAVVVPAASASPSVDLFKRQALAAGSLGRAGDRMLYSYRFANTGNVTISGVSVSDAQSGISALSFAWPGAPGVLSPGQSATATAEYSLTQADIDAGVLSSAASVTGTGVRGTTVVDTASDATRLAQSAALTIDKSSSLETVAQQGAAVLYRIDVRNSGNVTQSDVSVLDALPGLSALDYTWPSTPGRLLPDEILVVTARYVIGQTDVDATSISNTATASGVAPSGATTTVADTDVRPVPAVSKLTLTVAAAVADGAAGYPGDTVVFKYTARNDGTTALGNVRFADRRIGLSSFVYGDWPGADGVLLPGQSITATASYVLREGELGALLEVRAEVTAVLLGTSILVADTADAALQLPDPPDPATPLPSLPQVLAYTGSDQGMTLLGGFALLVFGLALTLTSRKKKRKDIA